MHSMTPQDLTSQDFRDLHHICDRLKVMGYAESKHIRIYGEDIEVLSDPFPEGNGIAVQGKSQRENRIRTIRLPLPVVQALRKSALQGIGKVAA